MAKPTQTTEWCSDASYVEPSAGKKVVGFDPAERPPAQYLDWIIFTIELWLLWLDAIAAPASGSESVSMSSAGDILANGCHGDRKLILSPLDYHVEQTGGETWSQTHARIQATTIVAGNTWLLSCPVDLRVGDRIRSIVWYEAAASQAHLYELVRVARATGVVTVVASVSSVDAEVVLSAIDHVVLEDFSYAIRVGDTVSGPDDDVTLRYTEVTYDRPA